MKKIILIMLYFFGLVGYGQTVCPTSIKTSGQSTPSEPIFTVPNGQNGCAESWEPVIYVNGLSYTYVGCNGGNLEYAIDPGQTPPSSFEMTIDFGNGLICEYDANGDYVDNTLSLNNIDLTTKDSVLVFPNPVSQGAIINIKMPLDANAKIEIYNVMGKLIREILNENSSDIVVDLRGITSGIYLVRIFSNELTVNKKIIIN